jgi:hypothetical protein
MRRCRLNGSDAQHWQGSLSDRMLIAENRCADLFVSTVSPETRIGTAACASVGARYRFTAPRCPQLPIAARTSVSAQMCLTVEQESELAGGW